MYMLKIKHQDQCLNHTYV